MTNKEAKHFLLNLATRYDPDEPTEEPTDMVNHPPHYTAGSIECIDAMRAALGRDGFIAFCKGQVIKYVWRAGLKADATEDARKAAWYLARMIREMETNDAG